MLNHRAMPVLAFILFHLGGPPAPAAEEFDLVITGGRVVDGTGKDPYAADVGIRDGKIVFMGALPADATARKTLDAKGRMVAPGFIDLHTHADEALIGNPALNFVRQGVTTVVTGNCGDAPSDVAGFFYSIDASGTGPNVVHLLGHNSIRKQVFGEVDRAPTRDELEKMKGILEKGMQDGAWGMSTGLWYIPGSFAKTDEVIELAKIVAKYGGIYASHMRDETDKVMDAVKETIEIGRKARLPVHISHIKAASPAMWGRAAEIAKLVENARKQQQKVTADQYPYEAWSTSLEATVIPAWAREGSDADLVKRFDDSKTGPRLRAEIGKTLKDLGGPQAIYITGGNYAGKNLQEIGEAEKKDGVAVVEQIQRGGGAQVVAHVMNEADVRKFMTYDWVATATDSGVREFGSGVPHPRGYGTFPRKIGLYARDEKVITFPFAVRSCSGLPADILGLKDRGYVRKTHWADLVVFDPEKIIDRATFEKPHQWSEGIEAVLVNGEFVVEGGQPTKAKPGKVLRRP